MVLIWCWSLSSSDLTQGVGFNPFHLVSPFWLKNLQASLPGGWAAKQLVMKIWDRLIPASARMRVSSLPDSPTNGRRWSDSALPQDSPTRTILAPRGPLVPYQGSEMVAWMVGVYVTSVPVRFHIEGTC